MDNARNRISAIRSTTPITFNGNDFTINFDNYPITWKIINGKVSYDYWIPIFITDEDVINEWLKQ